MDGDFLVPLHLIFMVNIITACLPKEYKINNTCCPMCDKGFFVKASCTEELSRTICEICMVPPHTDHPNGLVECFKCEQCDSGADLVVKQNCTESSHTVCECSDGHFCVSQECNICIDYTECQPGEYVKKPGDPVADTECDECPEGHYSDTNNAAQCSPWIKCVELGQSLYKEGNSTADSICKERRQHIAVLPAFAVPLLAAITYVVTCFCIGKQGHIEVILKKCRF
ncbi:tumor necrosis factor receptor superfamily member 14-like isoform X2 [Ranitomeya variabilis]|uniref:tumor necrosis factor receptor superfamily member 14-like isoform X2 n=1 Tax=Ranitomeya variabilis TaxID=490064 RepID=UPI0040578873